MDDAANKLQFEEAQERQFEPDGSDAAADNAASVDAAGSEHRAASRFTLLIRAARLVSHHGEFVCVIRDVSETGISLKMLHAVPDDEELELHMPDGSNYTIKTVWVRGREAGFEFAEPIDVAQLIAEHNQFPKRGMRLGLLFPITIRTLTGQAAGVVENLSQQGARFSTDALFAIDQTVRIDAEDKQVPFPEVRAKVRWRRDDQYGVVFDDTLSLSDFARLAAQLQCPRLLD